MPIDPQNSQVYTQLVEQTINVTKTSLPSLAEYTRYLEGIWRSGWVTNHGPLIRELEEALKGTLETPRLRCVNNGTIALQIAIKALRIRGEVITTPFSYVATTSSLVWEGCEPVFVDIDPHTLTLDQTKIESAIGPNTQAILATHVYGNPCDVFAIERIARKHGLKVIYDAAHAFGVHFEGKSLLNFGDISTLSFHATKLFHTIEGGAVISALPETDSTVASLMNFGHEGPENFGPAGINGKASEFNAAMGLCLLPKVAGFITARKKICELYDSILLKNSDLERPKIRENTDYNYAYYPVIFASERALLAAKARLNERSINPRRYFYPSLSQLNYVTKQETPVADGISKRIMCLPLYPELPLSDVERIATLVLEALEDVQS